MKRPIEKSPAHLRRIGIIAARWAGIDLTLSDLLARAIKNSEAAKAIYFSVNSQSLRFDQLRGVIDVTLWPGVGVKEMLLKRIDALDGLWKQRNAIMHNPVFAHMVRGQAKPNYVVHIQRPIRKVKVQEIPFTIGSLDSHIKRLTEIENELDEFINADAYRKIAEFRRQQKARERAKRKASPEKLS